MALETLEKDIDISGFVLNNPEQNRSNLQFDPERDISEEEYKNTIEYAKNKLKPTEQGAREDIFLTMATSLDILFPGRLNLDLSLVKEPIRYRAGSIKQWEEAAQLKQLYHNNPSIMRNAEFEKYIRPKIDTDTDYILTKSVMPDYDYLRLARNLKIIFFDSYTIPEMPKTISSRLMATLSFFQRELGYENWAELAANLKLIYPEYLEKLNISDEWWVQLKSHHEKLVNDNKFYQSVNFAKNLKILAYPSAYITERGIVTSLEASGPGLEEVLSPMPSQRKF